MNGRILWRTQAEAPRAKGAVVFLLTLVDAPKIAPTPRDLCEAPSREPSRARFLARRALTRELVAKRLGASIDEVVVGHASSGAPVVVAPATSLRLSVAARDEACAIAFGCAPIGVDIEPVGAPVEPAWNILHESERRSLAALDEASRHESFLRLWTAKEAYLKALGLGLAREPSQIAVIPRGEEAFALFETSGSGRAGEVALEAAQWRRFMAGGDAFIAACVQLREKPD